jgi:thiol:disulfide interchange protein DsbA
MMNIKSTRPLNHLARLLTRAGCVLFLVGAMAVLSLPAQAQQYVAGQHYTILDEPLTTSSGDKIEVMELFWYGCPHCYAFEPQVENWLKNKPENVEFVRVPAVFGRNWEFHARAYYTFEILGVLDQVHGDFFNAIHRDRKQINSESALVDFLADYGVSEENVESAFKSFATDNLMRRALTLARDSQARGVPAIVVDGKYLSGITEAGSQQALLDIVNYLVAKAESER